MGMLGESREEKLSVECGQESGLHQSCCIFNYSPPHKKQQDKSSVKLAELIKSKSTLKYKL